MEVEDSSSTAHGSVLKLLLSVDEACAALSVKKSLLYEFMNGRVDGKRTAIRLKSLRVGARRLIPLSALETFINQLGEIEQEG